jgi:hypothetical protein
VKLIAFQHCTRCICGIGDFAASGVFSSVQPASDLQSRRRRRAGDQLYDWSRNRASGSPRQLDEMNENSRCSTLFHLLVPGGKWQTATPRAPPRSANFCSSQLPEPQPPSVAAAAVGCDQDSLLRVRGTGVCPSARHQPRIEATAKAAGVVIGSRRSQNPRCGRCRRSRRETREERPIPGSRAR